MRMRFPGFYRHFPSGRRGDDVVKLAGVVDLKRYGVVIHYILRSRSVLVRLGRLGKAPSQRAPGEHETSNNIQATSSKIQVKF